MVRDAATGEVLAELSESLGTTTNNVAEYSGLVAGLETAAELAPRRRRRRPDGLQAGGRADVRPLADQAPGAAAARGPGQAAARRLGRVTYEWVPRARNAHADRLANQAMDEARNETAEAGQRGPSGRGPGARPGPGPACAAAGPRLDGGAQRADHHRAAPAR